MVAINAAYNPNSSPFGFYQAQNRARASRQVNQAFNLADSASQERLNYRANSAEKSEVALYTAQQPPLGNLVGQALGLMTQDVVTNLGKKWNDASALFQGFLSSAVSATAAQPNLVANRVSWGVENNPFSSASSDSGAFPLPFPSVSLQKSEAVFEEKLNRFFPETNPLSETIKVVAERLNRLDPESPKAIELQSQISQLLSENPNAQVAIPELFQAIRNTQKQNIQDSLKTILENIEPDTLAKRNIQDRISAVEKSGS